MNKILPILIIGILVLSGFGAIAQNSYNEKNKIEKIEYKNIGEKGNIYTHTVLGEFGTATWCGFCKYAHAALKNIYSGSWHPFYYISLVCDVNTHASQRASSELGLTGYPTVYFDGGYRTNVGAGSEEAAQSAYNISIVDCGIRDVSDVKIYCDIPFNVYKERFNKFYKWKGLTEEEIEDLRKKRYKDEYLVVKKTKEYSDIVCEGLS